MKLKLEFFDLGPISLLQEPLEHFLQQGKILINPIPVSLQPDLIRAH